MSRLRAPRSAPHRHHRSRPYSIPSPPSGAERAGWGGGRSVRAARPTSPSRRCASGPP